LSTPSGTRAGLYSEDLRAYQKVASTVVQKIWVNQRAVFPLPLEQTNVLSIGSYEKVFVMSHKFQNAAALVEWASSLKDDHASIAVVELAGQVGHFLRSEGSAGTSVPDLSRLLMALAPEMEGKIFANTNLASMMRSAAREIRHSMEVAA
jgi:hypothetical protein